MLSPVQKLKLRRKNSIMPTLFLKPYPKWKLCENWSFLFPKSTGFIFCMFSCFSTVWLAPNPSKYISLKCLQINLCFAFSVTLQKRDVFINWIIYLSSHYFPQITGNQNLTANVLEVNASQTNLIKASVPCPPSGVPHNPFSQTVAPAQPHLPCYYLLIWGLHTCKYPQPFHAVFITHLPGSTHSCSSRSPPQHPRWTADSWLHLPSAILNYFPQPWINNLPWQMASP